MYRVIDSSNISDFAFCKQWLEGKEVFRLHTSGSTGQPKPIDLGRTQIEASINATQKALGLLSEYTSLICLNTNYIAGTMMLARGLKIGMKMVVVAPSSNPLADIPDNMQIDFTAFVPLQIQTIIEAGMFERLNRMKVIIVGGAAINDKLLIEIQQLTVPVYSTYGMTETVSHVALRRLNGETQSDFYTLLEGIKAQTDERGCIGLYGELTNNEWVQTNDVVLWQDERRFMVVGRADNIINSGGIKIQLEKVERAIGPLLCHQRFYCWHEADEKLGQKLILVVEGQEDKKLLSKLKTSLSAMLSTYEIPKKVIFVEKFMETGSGKIDKIATTPCRVYE